MEISVHSLLRLHISFLSALRTECWAVLNYKGELKSNSKLRDVTSEKYIKRIKGKSKYIHVFQWSCPFICGYILTWPRILTSNEITETVVCCGMRNSIREKDVHALSENIGTYF